MSNLPLDILEIISYYLRDSDVFDFCQINSDTQFICNDDYWKRRAVRRGYLPDVKLFSAGIPREKYIFWVTKRGDTCIPGSENYEDDPEFFCVFLAGRDGDLKSVEYFIKLGFSSDVSIRGAAFGGQIQLLLFLLRKYGVNDVYKLLYSAIDGRRLDVMKVLVEELAIDQILINNIIITAAEEGKYDVAEFLAIEEFVPYPDVVMPSVLYVIEHAMIPAPVDEVIYLKEQGVEDLGNIIKEAVLENEVGKLVYIIDGLHAGRDVDIIEAAQLAEEAGNEGLADYLLGSLEPDL